MNLSNTGSFSRKEIVIIDILILIAWGSTLRINPQISFQPISVQHGTKASLNPSWREFWHTVLATLAKSRFPRRSSHRNQTPTSHYRNKCLFNHGPKKECIDHLCFLSFKFPSALSLSSSCNILKCFPMTARCRGVLPSCRHRRVKHPLCKDTQKVQSKHHFKISLNQCVKKYIPHLIDGILEFGKFRRRNLGGKNPHGTSDSSPSLCEGHRGDL